MTVDVREGGKTMGKTMGKEGAKNVLKWGL
jgi:hypothetical protein